jgi:hypothetical protein
VIKKKNYEQVISIAAVRVDPGVALPRLVLPIRSRTFR